MALLQVDGLSDRNPSLVLALEPPDQLAGRDVAVIGYPALDPRNPTDVQNRVFNSVDQPSASSPASSDLAG